MNKKINDDEIIINNGEKEFLLKILFTYENEDRNAKYCFVYEESNPDDVLVYRYDDEGNIFEIEDEEEFNEAQEVLGAFNEDPEFEKIKD